MKHEIEANAAFRGFTANGFLMLFMYFLMLALSVLGIVWGAGGFGPGTQPQPSWLGTVIIVLGVALGILSFIWLGGFILLEPNEACALLFFGKYRGNYATAGFRWVHPFMACKKVSLRARNLNADPIKVNDKNGNPIMIGMVLVWKLRDIYKALFEIDSQNMQPNANATPNGASQRMRAFENFVKVQSDAALRQVAGLYAYDSLGAGTEELTLRAGGDEINQQLKDKLNERLDMAGIEVVEARLNYLAYAPEIAAVMLRRQQAEAIISAREKIVEGAVSMVKMALEDLETKEVVRLSTEQKAAMVGNLLVVLCADESAQPVLNTGSGQ